MKPVRGERGQNRGLHPPLYHHRNDKTTGLDCVKRQKIEGKL